MAAFVDMLTDSSAVSYFEQFLLALERTSQAFSPDNAQFELCCYENLTRIRYDYYLGRRSPRNTRSVG